MLKRNIAILIAAGLLGGQVSLATAGESAFPSNDVEVYTKMLPGQLKYLEQRAASIKKEGAVLNGSSFARSVGVGSTIPHLTKHLAEQTARIQKEGAAVCGNSFPPSADAQYWKMPPAQVAYFEQRDPTSIVMASGTCPLRPTG